MKHVLSFFGALLLAMQCGANASDGFTVYPPVPGLAVSGHYTVRVRAAQPGSAAFPVNADRQYYIPGDTMVFGSFCNPEWENGHDIRIFGHGTLSGARLKHADALKKPLSGKKKISCKPIEIFGANDRKVEGITISDRRPTLQQFFICMTVPEPFEDLTLAGKPVRGAEFFKTNEFVDGFNFTPITVSKP